MKDIFFNDNYYQMWTAIGAIGQTLASFMAIAALIYSIRTFRKSLKTLHYGELDRMYFDLLRAALEKPHLTNPKGTLTDDQKMEYEIYAFMVWNFLEAIYDRCERDKDLCITWYPVMDAENCLHREWLDNPKNTGKFKDSFKGFIQSGRFKQQ